jgi:predicted ATP-grasp superfamily ATP-dependent carboligase
MRVLLLAATTGYQTRAFGDAAEQLGVDLVLATDRCHVLDDPWHDAAIPIRFHEEAGSVAAILEAARRDPIDGVVAVGDRPTVIAARAAKALGLPGHPRSAAAMARNKRALREVLAAANLPTPPFVEGLSTDPPERFASVGFPMVIKPLALSGSRGVMRVDDEDDLEAGLRRLHDLLQSSDVREERHDAHRLVLAERFIEGREFAIEGLMNRGALDVLAVFDKPDPLDGPFFEETIYVTPSRVPAEAQDAIVHAVGAASRALGLYHGPVHAECRMNPGGVYVLEVAARPIGGLCARALRFVRAPRTSAVGRVPAQESSDASAAVIPFEQLLLRHAMGESSTGWMREPCASGVMMIPIPARGLLKGVAGLDDARAVPFVEDVRITAKPDQVLVPLPEGASYLGFIFARAPHPAHVELALRGAHGRLAFTIAPEMRMLQS